MFLHGGSKKFFFHLVLPRGQFKRLRMVRGMILECEFPYC